jgi:guanyl-specific ribonuclease Sa
MLGELPGANLIKPTQTAEERAKYWKDGYDPIRKGRYWIMNSETPFIGGKISYFRPNFYRRALADAKYSDSLYGSRRERFAHMLNPNYYDVKNYNTRPYLLTSPAFENVPFVGPILSGTVGRLISPQKRMHEEYWNKDGVKSPSQIQQEEMQWNWAVSQSQMQYNNMRSQEASKQIEFNSQRDLGYIITLKDLSTQTIVEQNQRSILDNMTLAKVFGFARPQPIADPLSTARYNDGTFNSSLVAAISQPNGMKQIYRTNSGAMSVIQINGEYAALDKRKINKDQLRLGQVMSVNDMATAKNPPIFNNLVLQNLKFANPENPNSLTNSLKNQYKNSADVAGIYGFITTDFITGTPGAGQSMIETSGYSRSFNKAFYDQDLGGLSGDISEVFRRLVQKRRSDQNYYNPIRNTMPNWLPGGKDGFVDFLHGDPYTKIAHGEERLPGQGYERMNGIDMPMLLKMKSGSSTIGKTKDEIIKHFLHQDEITDPELMKKVKAGEVIHAGIEQQLKDSGVAIDTEVEMKDEKNGIIGYYDARIHDSTSWTGEAIVDIKTVGAKKLEKIRKSGKPVDYHQRQVNWYLHQTNPLSKGYIYYVDRDDPTNNYTVGFNYSEKMYKSTIDTLQQARQDVGDMLHKGMISRGDLYDPIDRFRVLADVAPYSKEFKIMNKQISNLNLDQKDMDKVKEIRDRVSEQRQQTRFYNYRFKNNNVIEETGVVDRQISNQTFKIEGSDTPIKLAGLKLNKTGNKHYQEAMDFMNEHMGEGSKIRILVSEDPTQRSNGDFLHSTKATVIADGININRELIKRGWAEEKTDDYSAAGVHARFGGLQRTFGSVWESIAHLDTEVNTKMLQVRTASEDYERKQVYGKDFKSWSHPIKDFVMPSIWMNMNRSAALGIGMGALGGYMLGKTSYGRFLGAAMGALTIAGAKVYKAAYEKHNGEKWVPEEKRKQRDLDEYLDKINFVKNRRLFEVYAEKALKEEHFDVKKFIVDQRMQGARRKAKAQKIENVKKQYKLTGEMKTGDFEKTGVKFNWQDKMPSFIRGLLVGDNKKNYEDTYNRIMDFGKSEKKEAMHNAQSTHSWFRTKETFNKIANFILGREERKINPQDLDYDTSRRRPSLARQWSALKKSFMTSVESSNKHKTKALEKTVNQAINDKKTNHKVIAIPKNAMKAIEYYNASESTMYGYDPGEPLANFMAALPKKDKDYFREFLKAPVREREEILEMAPHYMRRALQAAYKMPIDPKESLDSYFSKHALPDANWDGWQENFDMKSLRVKMVQSQGQGSLQSNDLWADDKLRADAYGPMPLPNMSYKSKNIQQAKDQLEKVLGQAGYQNLNFSFKFGASTPSINLDVYQNKKDQYDRKLKERLGIQ